ncbi:tetraspanin Tsp2 family [Gloeophyllum trabeum ATCC 11539]|uniref:Tetraspanin Tsp2 family n=1 Tax=Gloeophyllum trabeum (strain ATCC 11539 / FP-39264 / Madison 617) TaxID=670483 RepID=S7S2H3_GLOTA|nr:tetraspanin Tsp2 family [Gloeophyllum trabeum ATCC 11539]EPQ59959.1 tetraspanin Tsp2 family [Gloeophyllum trabeum ATCC 11539]
MDSNPLSRRASSAESHTPSTTTANASTRHILAGMHPEPSMSLPKLEPPALASPGSGGNLGANYIPSKFSEIAGIKRRKGKGAPHVTKRGGGREAFRADEARMPGAGDEDYDGVGGGWLGGQGAGRKMRWNKFKWTLFFGNLLLSIYSLVGLIFCLLTWFAVWTHSDIVRVGDRTELVLSTLAATLGIVTSLIGWAGILLNDRAFLAWYTFLLWVCFALLVTPGYVAYKRKTFNLEGKTNAQWSRALGTEGRLRIQNQLGCCGYFSPFIEATVSQACYARSILPGCKGPYMRFQRKVLERWYTVAFALVPLHIAVMVIGLLCSNHVTYRFGKGMMPKAYRLNLDTMAVIMDQYANQLAEQYGPDVASEIISRSRSNLQLDAMPTVGYTSGNDSGKYDRLRNR